MLYWQSGLFRAYAVYTRYVLSEMMTKSFLESHAVIDEEDGESYGLGVYRRQQGGKIFYYVVGVDAGVDFFTAYFPRVKIVVSVLGNTDLNTFPLLEKLISTNLI